MKETKRAPAIGDRITYAWHAEALTIVIGQKISRTARWALEGWMVAWLFIGIIFLDQMLKVQGDERLFLSICMAFWTFFAFRVFKVILWRRIGQEMIRISSEGMSVKNAFGTWGKAQFFLLENIQKMMVIRRNPEKFLQTLDQSFWIMGGDTLQFAHLGKTFVLGKQLSERDAKALAKLIDQALRKFK